MFHKALTAAFAAFVLGLVSLGVGSKPASAEVTKNVWLPAAYSPDNPCEPGTTPISLSGLQHLVWYTTPEGTLKMNIQAHLTGTDSDGTEYVANLQRHMEHFSWPSVVPFSDTFTTNLISKGSTVNAQIVVTYTMFPANPVVTVTACRG
ncbi:MAG: hypothetical protein HY875_11890 [Chloroflexi bacterium]|nr:hypothetical protein [Chloroflexota bacterium]